MARRVRSPRAILGLLIGLGPAFTLSLALLVGAVVSLPFVLVMSPATLVLGLAGIAVIGGAWCIIEARAARLPSLHSSFRISVWTYVVLSVALGVEHRVISWAVRGTADAPNELLVWFILIPGTLTVVRSTQRALVRTAKSTANIAFFRSFATESSKNARRAIVPILGAFGTVFYISNTDFDDELTDTWFGVHPDFLGDVPKNREATDATWLERVESMLRESDVVVADLTSPRANLVVDEVRAAVNAGLRSRICFIAERERAPQTLPAELTVELPVEGGGSFLKPLRYRDTWIGRIGFLLRVAGWMAKQREKEAPRCW